MLSRFTSAVCLTTAGALLLAGTMFGAETAAEGASQPGGAKVSVAVGEAVRAVPEAAKVQVKTQTAERKLQASYTIIAGLDGEIFPVFANYASLRSAAKREFGTVAVRIANSSERALRNRVSVQVPGWSDLEIQTVELRAGETRTLLFAPTFLPRLYENKEIVAATAVVNATDMAGNTVFSETEPVRLRSVDDMFWGPDFRYARFIASWVTPHDANVEHLLSRAKEFMPHRRLPGYEQNKPIVLVEKSTTAQVKAIYRALQEQGVSYVKSSMTFGAHQDVSERVRMPRESLDAASANCIDGVVLYASLFENLGLQPVVVLVPGHAYVGVRLSPKTDNYLYIETAITGRASFEASVDSAQAGLAKLSPGSVTRLSVQDARVNGIYPMPGTGTLSASRQPAARASQTAQATRDGQARALPAR